MPASYSQSNKYYSAGFSLFLCFYIWGNYNKKGAGKVKNLVFVFVEKLKVIDNICELIDQN